MYISIMHLPSGAAEFTRTRAASSSSPNRIFYLTVPPDVQALGSWCVTVGSVRTRPGDAYPPDDRRHPDSYRGVNADGRVLEEVQLVLITEGRGRFEDERHGLRQVQDAVCLVLMPGRWHRYRPDPRIGWREYWVGVRGQLPIQAVRLLGLDTRGPVIRLANQDELVERYEDLLRLAAVHDTASLLEMSGHVMALLALVARGSVSESGGAERADVVDRAIREMQTRVYGRVDMRRLARQAGVSEATFRRIFRDRTGSAPYRYYTALKINAVKRELAHTELPLKEIAFRLGFTDQYHLSRVFKHYTGLAPSVWRTRG